MRLIMGLIEYCAKDNLISSTNTKHCVIATHARVMVGQGTLQYISKDMITNVSKEGSFRMSNAEAVATPINASSKLMT